MWLKTLLAVVLLGAVAQIEAKPIFCFWGTWSHYRQEDGKFTVDQIDGSLCTHIMYAFFGIGYEGEVRILDSWLDVDLENIKKTVALKEKWPHLKIMASIGGWNEPSGTFSEVAGSARKREQFADNILAFMQQWGFDGVDLDWEYPGQRGGDPINDKANFVLMLQAISAKLKPLGYIMTIASGATETHASISYDIPAISTYLDYILVMTYDLHGLWDGATGHNSPLYAGPYDIDPLARILNIYECISYWIRQGCPKEKVVMGMPLYGRTFSLADAGNTGVGSPSWGGGDPGQWTQTSGMLGYNELCTRIQNGYTRVWDFDAHAPYAYKGNQWISYDDVESIEAKANLVNSMGLGGAMVWSLETEDFLGACGGGANPLMKALNRIVR